jgi:hypothetical protein
LGPSTPLCSLFWNPSSLSCSPCDVRDRVVKLLQAFNPAKARSTLLHWLAPV